MERHTSRLSLRSKRNQRQENIHPSANGKLLQVTINLGPEAVPITHTYTEKLTPTVAQVLKDRQTFPSIYRTNQDRNLLLEAAHYLYYEPLFRYIRRLWPYDVRLVANVVDQTFYKLLTNKRDVKSNLRSFLYQTAYHALVDENRYNFRYPLLGTFAVGNPKTELITNDSTGSSEIHLLFEQIVPYFNALNPDQRHTLILRFLEDFDLNQTATILGKEYGNIRVIQNRAIKHLLKILPDNLKKSLMELPLAI